MSALIGTQAAAAARRREAREKTQEQRDLFGEPLWRCGLIDPPWEEKGGGKIKRGADRHYPTAKTPDILRALRESGKWRPYANSHLWCWATDTFLCNGQAFWLIQQLGFIPKATFPWVKVCREVNAEDAEELDPDAARGMLGQYARKGHEHLILAVRGRGMDPSVYNTANRKVRSVIIAPHPMDERGRILHSRKPDKSYALIEARSHGPYWEGFGTRQREGWLPYWGPKNHHAQQETSAS